VRFCCFLKQIGCEELVDCNYFQWCSGQGIEEKHGPKNEEMDGFVVRTK